MLTPKEIWVIIIKYFAQFPNISCQEWFHLFFKPINLFILIFVGCSTFRTYCIYLPEYSIEIACVKFSREVFLIELYCEFQLDKGIRIFFSFFLLIFKMIFFYKMF